MRFVSRTTVLGLPLLAMAVGPDPALNERRGVAIGWVALRVAPTGGVTLRL